MEDNQSINAENTSLYKPLSPVNHEYILAEHNQQHQTVGSDHPGANWTQIPQKKVDMDSAHTMEATQKPASHGKAYTEKIKRS